MMKIIASSIDLTNSLNLNTMNESSTQTFIQR